MASECFSLAVRTLSKATGLIRSALGTESPGLGPITPAAGTEVWPQLPLTVCTWRAGGASRGGRCGAEPGPIFLPRQRTENAVSQLLLNSSVCFINSNFALRKFKKLFSQFVWENLWFLSSTDFLESGRFISCINVYVHKLTFVRKFREFLS